MIVCPGLGALDGGFFQIKKLQESFYLRLLGMFVINYQHRDSFSVISVPIIYRHIAVHAPTAR